MSSLNLRASEAAVDSLFANARMLYYASVTDKEKIGSAIDLFMKISQLDEKYQGRALMYIGSLTAQRAKFAFWPHENWKAAAPCLRKIISPGLCSDIFLLILADGWACSGKNSPRLPRTLTLRKLFTS